MHYFAFFPSFLELDEKTQELSYPLLTPMLTPPLRHSFDAIMGQGHADSRPLYICMSMLRVCVYVCMCEAYAHAEKAGINSSVPKYLRKS